MPEIEKVKDKLIFQINEFFINFSFFKLILKERTREFWIPNVASTQWPPYSIDLCIIYFSHSFQSPLLKNEILSHVLTYYIQKIKIPGKCVEKEPTSRFWPVFTILERLYFKMFYRLQRENISLEFQMIFLIVLFSNNLD